MARGGKREGKPGTAYSNRTDLNQPKPPVMRLTGQEYGQQATQVSQQQAVPAPAEREWTPPPAPVGLYGPTQFPDQPVTQGLPSGPGAGPEVLDVGGISPLDKLKRIYARTQNPDILNLIILAEGQ